MKIVKRDNQNDGGLVYSPIRSIFDDFFRFPTFEDFPSTNMLKNVSADIWEDDKNIYVKMAVPGMKEEDIKINIDDDYLTISAHTKVEEKEDGKKYYVKTLERSFEQSFNLPCRVNVDQSEAKLENGVINITLPKSEEARKKEIKITK